MIILKKIAAVILAAGASTRMGEPKQLLDWKGAPLLAHIADIALAAEFSPVIAVLGCHAEAAHTALGLRPIQSVMNWRWKEGLSTSVQTGLAALPFETEAAIFLQCDQPLITSRLLQTVAARFEETNAPIVHLSHSGQRSTPVLFARSLFSELTAVSGDEGGRAIIARRSDESAAVEVANPDRLIDIDTAADYQRALATHGAQQTRSCLSNIRHLIVDIDGVLWHGDEPMPGLQDFFAFLRQHKIGFILATNNSSRTPEQYAAKLARFGVQIPAERVLTSGQATASYLTTIAPPRTRVYAIGRKGLRQALVEHDFVVTDEDAAYVIVGWDRRLTWSKMKTAALLIHGGAKFIGSNPDKSFPTELGPVPGNGAQLAMLEATTGVAPTIVGKPESRMYKEALRRMGARAESTAMIGDRVGTDIVGAARAGLISVLLLSGISTEADVAASPVKPDMVYAGIEDFTQAWAVALDET